jgi:hypothetical protein
MVGMSLSGASSLIKRLAVAGAMADTYTAQAIYREALKIFAVSQRLVPVQYGNLKGSGLVTSPTKVSGGYEVLIGYGGPAAPYAVYVHEITTSYHKPPTQAKFLEQPVLEAAGHFGAQMSSTIGKFLYHAKGK